MNRKPDRECDGRVDASLLAAGAPFLKRLLRGKKPLHFWASSLSAASTAESADGVNEDFA
jgi:hypothetical protein